MTSILKVDEIQNTDGKTGLVITPDGSVSGVKYPEITGGDPARVITSTTMSSYEEGTWVPTIEGQTTAGTGTYSKQKGIYTRTGNLVACMGRVHLSAHTGTGNMVIAGLPFTQNNFQESVVQESVGAVMTTDLAYTKQQILLLGTNNTRVIRFYEFGPSTSASPVPMDTDFHTFFQFTYTTNE